MVINYKYATIKIYTANQKTCTRLKKEFYQNAKQFLQNIYDIHNGIIHTNLLFIYTFYHVTTEPMRISISI